MSHQQYCRIKLKGKENDDLEKKKSETLHSLHPRQMGKWQRCGDIIRCACRCRRTWPLGEAEIEAQNAANALFPAAA